MSGPVDWPLARRIAGGLAGEDKPPPAPEDLGAIASQACERVVAATGMEPLAPLPEMEWVGRGAWSEANIGTLAETLGPLLDRVPAGPAAARAAGAALAGAEIGALLGMFSRRVLGQYELSLVADEARPRLLLVGSNLTAAARQMQADEGAVVTWVTIHEVTHGVQFGAVPWLRDHLGGLLGELLEGLDVRPDLRALARVDLDGLRSLAGRLWSEGVAAAALGPERKATLDRLQATMTLVEGHAEHVMDLVGADVVEGLPHLREGMERRRSGRSPLLKVLDRLLGIDLKLRQYESGKRFCDAVAHAGGQDALRLAWSSPEALPTTAELENPGAWMARVG